MNNQTIYALSTVYGKSGVAVVRISGEEAINVIKKITDIEIDKIKTRHAYFSNIKDLNGNILDKSLIIYFNSPYSFTGEDVVELHIHGSKAVVSSILDC